MRPTTALGAAFMALVILTNSLNIFLQLGRRLGWSWRDAAVAGVAVATPVAKLLISREY